jgi:GNAT superfamily N-acetyltransferase
MTRIERVAALPPDLPALAAAAAREGFGMLAVLAAEWADGTQRFAGSGEALFVARDDGGGLLGLGGITRDPFAEALRMRRFYVRPNARGQGVGAALAAAALAHARGAGARLVRLRAPAEAARFWERCGFARLPPGADRATHALWPGSAPAEAG